ncbi:hypothetical protein ABL78_6415 [Leptomonas seymouri]|uniref:mRNA 5'-phosphatase n=1 Tax=Leptomonas seymouri TaxID=5684 RepID=A0A0N1I3D6_LEPSE|nr:hypothetical protein ABL78_6415 [Leptomonas seymouri]|eukprot:KPI84530.1 hypothetical protein ABL78_6415 [Leptomonas seymouri]
MTQMRGIPPLPRYRDPITRSVARLLLRSLQEQHRAPSSVTIECEARFGQLVGLASTRRREFPLTTATAAIIDSLHSTLYSFEPGVARHTMAGVELALQEKGIASPSDFRSRAPRYAMEDVLLLGEKGTRVTCSFGTLMKMQQHAKTMWDGDGHRSTVSPSPPRTELSNPFSVYHAIVPQSMTAKHRIAFFDMCCPGWGADLRYSVASETALPMEPRDVVATLPQGVRYRNRVAFAVSPFFTVYLTYSLTRYDAWWHPSHSLHSFCRPSDVARLGKGTVIPVPPLFQSRDSETRQHHEYQRGNRTFNDVIPPTNEIEVEVNVNAVLQAWKRQYGGANASAYLSSAELVSTTIAGTSFDIPSSSQLPANAPLCSDASADADVRAFALAEREDPFLLRVAEDYLALLQYLGQLRVTDEGQP